MRAIFFAIAVASTGCGRSETFPGVADVKAALDAGLTCDRDGGMPKDARADLPNGVSPAWGDLDACINVSYDVELEPVLNDLRDALADWSFPSCTWICFTAPTAGGGRPSAPTDRRIHLALANSNDGEPAVFRANAKLHTTDDGEIFSATMLINQAMNEPGKPPLLKLVGVALGFYVNGLNLDFATALRPADEQSVCALYPSCR